MFLAVILGIGPASVTLPIASPLRGKRVQMDGKECSAPWQSPDTLRRQQDLRNTILISSNQF
jgi:hypothetical protein